MAKKNKPIELESYTVDLKPSQLLNYAKSAIRLLDKNMDMQEYLYQYNLIVDFNYLLSEKDIAIFKKLKLNIKTVLLHIIRHSVCKFNNEDIAMLAFHGDLRISIKNDTIIFKPKKWEMPKNTPIIIFSDEICDAPISKPKSKSLEVYILDME